MMVSVCCVVWIANIIHSVWWCVPWVDQCSINVNFASNCQTPLFNCRTEWDWVKTFSTWMHVTVSNRESVVLILSFNDNQQYQNVIKYKAFFNKLWIFSFSICTFDYLSIHLESKVIKQVHKNMFKEHCDWRMVWFHVCEVHQIWSMYRVHLDFGELTKNVPISVFDRLWDFANCRLCLDHIWYGYHAWNQTIIPWRSLLTVVLSNLWITFVSLWWKNWLDAKFDSKFPCYFLCVSTCASTVLVVHWPILVLKT